MHGDAVLEVEHEQVCGIRLGIRSRCLGAGTPLNEMSSQSGGRRHLDAPRLARPSPRAEPARPVEHATGRFTAHPFLRDDARLAAAYHSPTPAGTP